MLHFNETETQGAGQRHPELILLLSWDALGGQTERPLGLAGRPPLLLYGRCRENRSFFLTEEPNSGSCLDAADRLNFLKS